MLDQQGHQVAESADIGVPLLDDAYVTWFMAERESEQALHAWFDAASARRRLAYVTYRAALDREEAAAHDLQRLSGLPKSSQKSLAHPGNWGAQR